MDSDRISPSSDKTAKSDSSVELAEVSRESPVPYAGSADTLEKMPAVESLPRVGDPHFVMRMKAHLAHVRATLDEIDRPFDAYSAASAEISTRGLRNRSNEQKGLEQQAAILLDMVGSLEDDFMGRDEVVKLTGPEQFSSTLDTLESFLAEGNKIQVSLTDLKKLLGLPPASSVSKEDVDAMYNKLEAHKEVAGKHFWLPWRRDAYNKMVDNLWAEYLPNRP